MLGVVGFDGGTKNAIALAIPPPGTTSEPEGTTAPSGPSGACCYDDGSCVVQPELDCDNAGGTYQGDDTDCAPTGACCIGTACSTTTATCCTGAGGTYQGDGTPCAPNPCATGACCVGSDCTVETASACSDAGGTYQGDGTTCDPNPCLPSCSCGFDAFDGSGRTFLTRTWTVTGHYHYEGDICHCTLDYSFTLTETYDPVTCEVTTDCTGSYTYETESTSSSGDWCTNNSFGCGICAGNCNVVRPSSGIPSCGGDCTCSGATSMSCSHSGGTTNVCNCAAGHPPNVVGTCTLTQTVDLSDECILSGMGAFSPKYINAVLARIRSKAT